MIEHLKLSKDEYVGGRAKEGCAAGDKEEAVPVIATEGVSLAVFNVTPKTIAITPKNMKIKQACFLLKGTV
eukprot:CCRYP_019140-RA/>CCRYP_019140-RA protein AED:0.21 eAED:0.21 QI:908/0/0.5/1/0/0/2/0/70